MYFLLPSLTTRKTSGHQMYNQCAGKVPRNRSGKEHKATPALGVEEKQGKEHIGNARENSDSALANPIGLQSLLANNNGTRTGSKELYKQERTWSENRGIS